MMPIVVKKTGCNITEMQLKKRCVICLLLNIDGAVFLLHPNFLLKYSFWRNLIMVDNLQVKIVIVVLSLMPISKKSFEKINILLSA